MTLQYDYLRAHTSEVMCQYINHTHLVDPEIPRRKIKKQSCLEGEGDAGGQV
jgi:hypothetical protein